MALELDPRIEAFVRGRRQPDAVDPVVAQGMSFSPAVNMQPDPVVSAPAVDEGGLSVGPPTSTAALQTRATQPDFYGADNNQALADEQTNAGISDHLNNIGASLSRSGAMLAGLGPSHAAVTRRNPEEFKQGVRDLMERRKQKEANSAMAEQQRQMGLAKELEDPASERSAVIRKLAAQAGVSEDAIAGISAADIQKYGGVVNAISALKRQGAEAEAEREKLKQAGEQAKELEGVRQAGDIETENLRHKGDLEEIELRNKGSLETAKLRARKGGGGLNAATKAAQSPEETARWVELRKKFDAGQLSVDEATEYSTLSNKGLKKGSSDWRTPDEILDAQTKHTETVDKDKNTRAEKARGTYVEGYETNEPGILIAPKEAGELKAMVAAGNAVRSGMNELGRLEKQGLSNPNTNAQAAALAQSLALILKGPGFADLGALSGPDQQILTTIAKNPADISNIIAKQFGWDRSKNAFKGLMTAMRARERATAQAMGLHPAAPKSLQAPTAARSAPPGMVNIQAPDGSVMPVPVEKKAYYVNKGGKVVP